MGKLLDIKETSLVLSVDGGDDIGGIEEYSLSRGKNSIGYDFTVVFPRVETRVNVGDSVTFKGVKGIVTSKEISASGDGGYVTVLNCASEIAVAVRKAPLKSLMYMSMTPDEKVEFDISCEGDYSSLDYIPLIKICDPKTFLGGWKSNDVIQDLANRAGLEVVCNVYSYWLRQVNASNSNSYMETILSLVNFLNPIVYEQDGVIYILERDAVYRGGTLNLSKVQNVTQRYTYNFDSKAKYFKVKGGYGQWIREKSKIPVEPERETTITSVTYSEKPMYVTVNIRGEKKVVDKNTGSTSYEFGGMGSSPVVAKFGYFINETMKEKVTTTEVWRLDPYGNYKAILSRHIVKENLTLGVRTMERTETFEYDFLDEEFEKPRMRKQDVVIGRYKWIVTQLGGQAPYYAFSGNETETSKVWIYSDNGTLLEEVELEKADCLKIGDTYVLLSQGDFFLNSYDSVERIVVRETVSKYRQISPDLYEVTTTVRKFGPLARKVGEEIQVTAHNVVRGRVPRIPKVYRKMIVEYGDEVEEGTIDAPVMTISNPNIICWEDARVIYEKLKRQVSSQSFIERVVTVPVDLPVEVGVAVAVLGMLVGRNYEKTGGHYQPVEQKIPEIGSNYTSIVASFEKRKVAGEPSEETVIMVESR